MKTLDKFTQYAVRRAWLATVAFLVWFIIALHIYPVTWSSSWALVCFYILLLINTFFSIRVFATISPRNDMFQHLIDIVLGLCLVILPVYISSSLVFALLCLLLFITATLKYIFLVPIVGHSKLLQEKIRVDTLGILMCFLFLIGVFYASAYVSSIILLIIFFCANVYVLWRKPLYKLEHHIEELFGR